MKLFAVPLETSHPTSSWHSFGSQLTALGYAAFLAVSWTWCIGMFLPGLLVEQFGVWGWVVFAVPNILGAGAMGFVLSQGSSQRFVSEHRLACIVFSLVTIAFHLFWVGWFIRAAAGPVAMIGFAVLLMIMALLTRKNNRFDLLVTGLVFVLSAAILFTTQWNHFPRMFTQVDFPSASEAFFNQHLIAMLPVCVLGFLLCPYLDLTFHRVCQETDNVARRIAFSVGFVLFFFMMIRFSLDYSIVQRVFLLPAEQQHAVNLQRILTLWRPYLMIHMLAQASITVALHAHAVRAAINSERAEQSEFKLMHTKKLQSISMAQSLLLVAALAVAVPMIAQVGVSAASPGMSVGEVAYRMFMGFYGLLFPAYVWIIAVPQWRRGSEPSTASRADWICLIAVTILAMPMFWLGFIAKQTNWLVPGVTLILVAGLWRLGSGMRNTR